MIVGRGIDTDICQRDDPIASNIHFAIWSNGEGCFIEDLGSNKETLLNGHKVRCSVIKNNDEIVAGITHFVLRTKDGVPPRLAHCAPLPSKQFIRQTLEKESNIPAYHDVQGLIEILANEAQPLFAILDAARDPQVLQWLEACKQDYQSLYEGPRGKELADCAPYLVQLAPGSFALETLVQTCWGKGWGIFLSSSGSFKEVRRHLRRLLLVQTEDNRKLYFRFYDPLIWNAFLRSCAPTELSHLFGPIKAYWTEDGCANVVRELAIEATRLCERIRKPRPRSSSHDSLPTHYDKKPSVCRLNTCQAHVSLEPLTAGHLEVLQQLLVDMLQKGTLVFSDAQHCVHLEADLHKRHEGRHFPFAVLADDQIAGQCTLRQVDLHLGIGTLGIWIGLPFRRRGIATAAIRDVTTFGFMALQLRIIRALSESSNHAANRVLEKAGMPCIRRLRAGIGPPWNGATFDYHLVTLDQWKSSPYDYHKSAATRHITPST